MSSERAFQESDGRFPWGRFFLLGFVFPLVYIASPPFVVPIYTMLRTRFGIDLTFLLVAFYAPIDLMGRCSETFESVVNSYFALFPQWWWDLGFYNGP